MVTKIAKLYFATAFAASLLPNGSQAAQKYVWNTKTYRYETKPYKSWPSWLIKNVSLLEQDDFAVVENNLLSESQKIRLLEFGFNRKLLNYNKINENGDTLLHRTIDLKQEAVAIAIAQLNDTKVNLKNKNGSTPLHLAVKHNLFSIAKLLIERGANTTTTDNNGQTPCDIAIQQNNSQMAGFLNFYANPDTIKKETELTNGYKNDDQYGIMYCPGEFDTDDRVTSQNIGAIEAKKLFRTLEASKYDWEESKRIERLGKKLKKLIFTDINSATDEAGDTILRLAVSQRSWPLETIKFLIAQGADINKKGKAGFTPLQTATCHGTSYSAHSGIASEGDTDLVEFFIKLGAKIDSQSDDGRTALHLASCKGYSNTIQLLIDNGANINAKDFHGSATPLCWAFHSFDAIAATKVLVKNGANIYEEDSNHHTVIDYTKKANVQQCAPLNAAYITMVAAFYDVKNKKMAFSDFSQKYFTGPLADKNIADISDLLHLGTKQFAREFFEWRTENKKIEIGEKKYQSMIFNMMEKRSEINQKIALLPLMFPLPPADTTTDLTSQLNSLNLTVEKKTRQPVNGLKRKLAEFMCQEKLKSSLQPVQKTRKTLVVKKTIGAKQYPYFCDCSIHFTRNLP